MRNEVPITSVSVAAYRVPTDQPEADGTYAWNATTMVLVHVQAGGAEGLGYTYADTATATLIRDMLADVVCGCDAMRTGAAWDAMVHAIRNLGRPGIASMAISAVDTALWDLKGKLLGTSVFALLGASKPAVDIYGSGGFTTYDDATLREQLSGWVDQGIPRVKMKIGSEPKRDFQRVQAARDAIGDAELFVDANGAYSRKQALAFAERFDGLGVNWFEEPVSSDDLAGLHLMRDRAPAGMDVAAGEYGYDSWYFRRMLEANAVDVLQADATRCGGITGFLQAAALCDAFQVPLSAHCAPSLHAAVGCASPRVRHLEYFHDHVRIEGMFFDGVLRPVNGQLQPDPTCPGLGLVLRDSEAEKYRL